MNLSFGELPLTFHPATTFSAAAWTVQGWYLQLSPVIQKLYLPDFNPRFLQYPHLGYSHFPTVLYASFEASSVSAFLVLRGCRGNHPATEPRRSRCPAEPNPLAIHAPTYRESVLRQTALHMRRIFTVEAFFASSRRILL